MLGYTGQQWVTSVWKSCRIPIPVPLFWFFKVYTVLQILLPNFLGHFDWLVIEKNYFLDVRNNFIFIHVNCLFSNVQVSNFIILLKVISIIWFVKINASIIMIMLKQIDSIFVWILCTQLGKEHIHCLCTCPSVL